MAVSDFYTARWPDFICISAHYKYYDDDDDDDELTTSVLLTYRTVSKVYSANIQAVSQY